GGAQLADQSPEVQTAVRAVAEHVQQIFAAADLELDAGYPAEVPTLMLGPGEIAAIEAALHRVLRDTSTPAPAEQVDAEDDGSLRRRADEARLRRLELAARLPVLAARAG